MILDIDNKPADPMDLSDIWHECKCINCGKNFNGWAHIVFVRLSTGQLLWWHKFSCKSAKDKLSTENVAS